MGRKARAALEDGQQQEQQAAGQEEFETVPMLDGVVGPSSSGGPTRSKGSIAAFQPNAPGAGDPAGLREASTAQLNRKGRKKYKPGGAGGSPNGSKGGGGPPAGTQGAGLLISGATGWEADAQLDPQADGQVEAALQKACKYLMYGIVIGPWKFVRGLGWCLNQWQRLCRPISVVVFMASDVMDKYAPTVHAAWLWLWNTWSLLLHFLSVIYTFQVAHLLWTHQHKGPGQAIIALYVISHYLMGTIMYMEMDRIKHAGRYTFSELLTFLQRVVEALFWDLQLLVSLVHSNCMLEGLTQMLLKGYEEARVCVHMIVNTLPMCIVLGVLYSKVAARWIADFDIGEGLDVSSYEQQIQLALVFSILNALEKWIRLSLADPWLHPDLDDCYPLAFMRSNAARLPRGLMLEWLFRCNLQLTQQDDELVLRRLFAIYTFNCKGDARELCDGHKAYLLRKALRTFNGSGKLHQAEVIARRLDKSKFRDPRTIKALDASDIHPGRHMSSMLTRVLGDSVGFTALNLANNQLGDQAMTVLLDGLRANRLLQLRVLILNANDMRDQGTYAAAKLLADSRSLVQLMLAGNPLGDGGVKVLCDALGSNKSLLRLDLTDVAPVGPESGSALGSMLKGNGTLQELCLRGVQLGAAGVEAIAKGLRANVGLKVLDLSASGADDRAASALAQALSSNKTLTRLDLSFTRVGDEGAKALCDAMQYNVTLQSCELSNTSADKSWSKLIANIVSGRGGAAQPAMAT